MILSAVLLSASVALPPKRYRHPPRMRVQITEGTPEQVERFCRRSIHHNQDRRILACSLPGEKLCVIILPHGYSQDLRTHEEGHCNGWKH